MMEYVYLAAGYHVSFTCLLILQCLHLWICTAADAVTFTGAREYCRLEKFEARCEQSEVIVIDQALYGRMKTGRCIRSDPHNTVGCKSEVTSILDKRCSGELFCSFGIPDYELERQVTTCRQGTDNYLQVAYRCVKIFQPSRQACQSCDVMKITSPPQGYLSSKTTELIGCGSKRCPWLLEADSGQHIIVSILDFNTTQQKQLIQSGVCVMYVIIKEMMAATRRTVCGGQERERVVYTSSGNHLELQIPTSAQHDKNFLLLYQFIGCSDLELAGDEVYTFVRQSDSAFLECKTNRRRSPLICNGTEWTGPPPDCEDIIVTAEPAAVVSSRNFVDLFSTSVLTFSWEMAIILLSIVVFGMVACSLIVGIVSIKTQEMEVRRQQQLRQIYRRRSQMRQSGSAHEGMGGAPSREARRTSSKSTHSAVPREERVQSSQYEQPYHVYDEPLDSPPPPYTDKAAKPDRVENLLAVTSSSSGQSSSST